MEHFEMDARDEILSQQGTVHQLETFGLVDGPGVRCVVFLSGCAMRCQYCHNPDTWSNKGEQWTAGDLLKKIKRYRAYWKDNGGLTVSGGEPLLQLPFVNALFQLAHQEGIHTALDTAGQPFQNDAAWMGGFEQLMSVTDLVLLDLKMMDPQGHRNLTGAGNENILQMAQWLSDHQKPIWIRHVLVPGLTDQPEDLRQMYKFLKGLNTLERVEVLPYHTLGVAKWAALQMPYPLDGVPVPTEEQIRQAEELLHVEEFSPRAK